MSKPPKNVGDMSYASQRRHGYVTEGGDFTDKGFERFTPTDHQKMDESTRSMNEKIRTDIENQREEAALRRKQRD